MRFLYFFIFILPYSYSSIAFADYYTATISCTTYYSPGASMYSHIITVDQCIGSISVVPTKIVFSDILYYPTITLTTHHSDGSVFIHDYLMAYTDNCNLSIVGDPSCLLAPNIPFNLGSPSEICPIP